MGPAPRSRGLSRRYCTAALDSRPLWTRGLRQAGAGDHRLAGGADSPHQTSWRSPAIAPGIQARGAGRRITGLEDQRHPRGLRKPNSSGGGWPSRTAPGGQAMARPPPAPPAVPCPRPPGPERFRPPAWVPGCGLGGPALGRGHPGSQLPPCTPSGLGPPHSSDFPFMIIPEF